MWYENLVILFSFEADELLEKVAGQQS